LSACWYCIAWIVLYAFCAESLSARWYCITWIVLWLHLIFWSQFWICFIGRRLLALLNFGFYNHFILWIVWCEVSLLLMEGRNDEIKLQLQGGLCLHTFKLVFHTFKLVLHILICDNDRDYLVLFCIHLVD
jgi:hypothetical protein